MEQFSSQETPLFELPEKELTPEQLDRVLLLGQAAMELGY